MKFPLSNKYIALATLTAVASIALVTGCSSSGKTVEEPTPSVLPATEIAALEGFIKSEDCNDLKHGKLPSEDISITTGGATIVRSVEIADESSERAQGLMCRTPLPNQPGMYFQYQEPRSGGFWMYNTYEPLDILYINRLHRVVDKFTMTPCLRDGLNDERWRTKCTREAVNYSPAGAYIAVLEAPAGWADDYDIEQMLVLPPESAN